MGRGSYLFFSVIFIFTIYIIMTNISMKQDSISSATTYFVVPFIGLNLFMSIFTLLRWFMKQHPKTSETGITFLHATWVCGVCAFIGYKYAVAGGNIGKMFSGMI
jgi:hypothetical protein